MENYIKSMSKFWKKKFFHQPVILNCPNFSITCRCFSHYLNLLFLPGFQRATFEHSIRSEVLPLVINMRSIMFGTTYLLLVWASAMLLCQIIARVIFGYLKNSSHIKRTKIYQLPSQCSEVTDPAMSGEKFENHSVFAESCESGVYDMTNWMLAVVSQVWFWKFRQPS